MASLKQESHAHKVNTMTYPTEASLILDLGCDIVPEVSSIPTYTQAGSKFNDTTHGATNVNTPVRNQREDS
jgi:hypothetical protein